MRRTTPPHMGRNAHSRPRAAVGLLLGVCLALLIAGCGRGAKSASDSFADLRITRYRYNIDEEHKTARVMAEITNPGAKPVSDVPVTAILRGPDGSERGRNSVTIEHLKAGETRVFSVSITTHGRERDVDFQIGNPPPETQAPGNAPPGGSAQNQ